MIQYIWSDIMNNLESNLNKALSICNNDITYLTEYSKIYTFTTENINGYIDALIAINNTKK